MDLARASALKPLDELFNAIFDRRLWIVFEQASGFAYVGIRLRHVSGLRRLAINLSPAAEFSFE